MSQSTPGPAAPSPSLPHTLGCCGKHNEMFFAHTVLPFLSLSSPISAATCALFIVHHTWLLLSCGSHAAKNTHSDSFNSIDETGDAARWAQCEDRKCLRCQCAQMCRNVPKCVRIVCAAYRKFASSPVAHPLDADAIPSPLSAHFVCILSANMRFRFQTLQVQHVHKETTRSRRRSRSRSRRGARLTVYQISCTLVGSHN